MAYLAARHPAGHHRVALSFAGWAVAGVHRCLTGDTSERHGDRGAARIRAVPLVGAHAPQPDSLAAEGSAVVSPRRGCHQRSVSRLPGEAEGTTRIASTLDAGSGRGGKEC